MTLACTVALGVAVVLLALAALHVRWAFRGESVADRVAVVPTRADGRALFAPGRAATLAVAAALAGAALVMLVRGGLLPFVEPAVGAPWLSRLVGVGAWAVGLAFLLRAIGDFRYVGLFKRERRTRFAAQDTRYYTPLCVLLAAGAMYVAAA